MVYNYKFDDPLPFNIICFNHFKSSTIKDTRRIISCCSSASLPTMNIYQYTPYNAAIVDCTHVVSATASYVQGHVKRLHRKLHQPKKKVLVEGQLPRSRNATNQIAELSVSLRFTLEHVWPSVNSEQHVCKCPHRQTMSPMSLFCI